MKITKETLKLEILSEINKIKIQYGNMVTNGYYDKEEIESLNPIFDNLIKKIAEV